VDVEVRVVRAGAVLTGAAVRRGLGNDPPAIQILAVSLGETGEVTGIANLGFLVIDSSQDRVSLIPEYLLLDDPGAGFCPATPASGVPPDEIPASPGGRVANFFWDVVADVGLTEHEVQFRITPVDGTVDGDPASITFRVDNNLPPQLSVNGGNFILNQDARRGIPLAFRVVDGVDGGVGDDVRLLVQWARDPLGFPSLTPGGEDLTPAIVEEILSDPQQRKSLQIATEIPLRFEGRLGPSSAPDRARLPELAGSAASLVERITTGSDGGSLTRVRGTLEILRPFSAPRSARALWAAGSDLQGPVSAHPVRGGEAALVLEGAGSSWQLRGVELATGRDGGVLASGPGRPLTLAAEIGGGALLVAVAIDPSPSWEILRVPLPPDASAGQTEVLITSDGALGAPVRGMANLGSDATVITAGDALLRLETPPSLPARLSVVVGPCSIPPTPLRSPWGVVVDPSTTNGVLVAENGGDRVLSIALDTRIVSEVLARPAAGGPGPAFPRPESLALEREGSRLLVVTDSVPSDSRREIVGLDLREGDRVSFAVRPDEEESGFPGVVGDLSTGPSGLRLLALSSENDLALGGGVEQSRRILEKEGDYDRLRQEVRLDRPADPPLLPGQPWRIVRGIGLVPGRRQGTSGVFVWDSADLVAGGPAYLRVIPLDSDVGGDEVAGARFVKSPLEVTPVLLPASPPASPRQFFRHVAAQDLDADGDVDLVAVSDLLETDLVTVFEQVTPLSFSSVLRTFSSAAIQSPEFIEIADLYDDDGKPDLAIASSASSTLVLLQQTTPLDFTQRQVLGGPGQTTGVRCLAVADVDCDGDLDLVSANPLRRNLTIFLREGSLFDENAIPVESASLGEPSCVAVADLNGDGRLDLVSADREGDTIVLLFQDVSGAFDGPPAVLNLAPRSRPLSLVVADLSGDGALDLACANEGTQDLAVFFRRASGEFGQEPDLLLGGPGVTGGPRFLTAADLDGDGRIDLACANSTDSPVGNSVSTFLQTAPGEFSLGVRVRSPLIARPRSVIPSDVDGDGAIDLVVTSDDDLGAVKGRVAVFPRETTARLGFSREVLGDSTLTQNVRHAAVGDLDGDGDLDFVTANRVTNDLTLFFQIAPRQFLPSGRRPVTGFRPEILVLADLDGDGDLDIACANEGDDFAGTPGSISVHYQSRPGVFDEETLSLESAKPGTLFFPDFVTAADVDGDGRIDLVATSCGVATKECPDPRDRVSIFFQDGASGFEGKPLVLEDGLDGPCGVAAADVNGDGEIDLLVANENADEVVLFLRQSEGGFATRVLPLPPGTVPRRLAVADLDANGHLDIITSNNVDATYLLQGESGVFAPPISLRLAGNRFFDVTAIDVDDDGDLDIVCATENSSRHGEVLLYLQDKPGRFDPAPRILTTSAEVLQRLRSVQAFDVDGDADLDLLLANSSSDDVTIFYR
jgi:hypothetical protein